jgi:alginate O-acetyltransferase complex protein AlgJ
VPSKARIYPEHVGRRRPAAMHEGLYARGLDALRRNGIAAPDLVRTMEACKREQPAYLRTDTHWTAAGARCAAQAVQAAVAAGAARDPAAPQWRSRTLASEPHRGDLLAFLPLDPYFAALLPEPETIERRRTERVEGAGAEPGQDPGSSPGQDPGSSPGQDLLGETPAPPVVLVGTSYSADERWNLTGALQEALQDDVVNYAAAGKGPFEPMLEYLLNADQLPSAPRLLVWEIPERYLPIAQELRASRATPAAACATGSTDTTL